MSLAFAPERIEHWPLDRLHPYAQNARTHDADQVAKIAASMAEFGWTVPCLVGEDGELMAGHGRVLAAEQLGLTEAPVIVMEHLTEAQRRAYRIADNRLTDLSGWDESVLSAELQELLAEDFDLSLTGFDDGELDRLLADTQEDDEEGGSTPPVVIPEPPRNPASRSGDLWILGEHRLLCGDATSHADVRRLMNGERSSLFATDPPYLVDYDGSNHPTRNKDWSQSYGTSWDDSSQGADLYDGFIAAAMAEAITEDAAWYCWHASRRQAMHVGQEVEVHYRWHPYFGRQLRCENSEERANGRIIHLVVAPGHVITAPAWMIDPVACAAMDLGTPHVSLAALLDLHKLLIERDFRRGSPDGFTTETQHEDLAITDTISRDRSPAQHALRSAEAEWAEFSTTGHGDRPARQRADGRRRRRSGGGGELR